MRTDSTRAPSDRRWSAFSVRPPSATLDLGLGQRVEPEGLVRGRARRLAGRVRISAALRAPPVPPAHSPSATWRSAVGGLGALGQPGRELVRQRPPTGRVAGRRRVRRSTAGGAAGASKVGASVTRRIVARQPAPTVGSRTSRETTRQAPAGMARARPRPRRNSAPPIRRPPAGWTSSSTSRPSVVASAGSPSTHDDPPRLVRRSPTDGPTRARRPAGRPPCRGGSPATAGTPGPGARARSPIGADRAGRPRGGGAGSASPTPRPAGRAGRVPASHPASDAAHQLGAGRRRPRLELRGRLGPVERPAGHAPRSARVQPRVHPDEGDPGLAVAGQDRRPGSATRRGGAAAATGGR